MWQTLHLRGVSQLSALQLSKTESALTGFDAVEEHFAEA